MPADNVNHYRDIQLKLLSDSCIVHSLHCKSSANSAAWFGSAIPRVTIPRICYPQRGREADLAIPTPNCLNPNITVGRYHIVIGDLGDSVLIPLKHPGDSGPWG